MSIRRLGTLAGKGVVQARSLMKSQKDESRRMKSPEAMESLLHEYPQYEHLLFRRGYLLTDSEQDPSLDDYPFNGHWQSHPLGELGEWRAIVHEDQSFHQTEDREGLTVAIIGHAYNPFTMQHEESAILSYLREGWLAGRDLFFERVSELTGIHLVVVVEGKTLVAVQDCAGMESCYFGVIEDASYVTSHPQLVADLLRLDQDPYVKKLVETRTYNIGNRHLPGNSSPFKELKRLGPNTYVELKNDKARVQRFWPTEDKNELADETEIRQHVSEVAEVLRKNLALASLKWERPAISMTGGTDSRTTVSASTGIKDRFKYFTYHAKPQELVDAGAAQEIANELSLDHTLYAVPRSNEEIKDFAVLKQLIEHNTSYFKRTSDHELRKMIFLLGVDDFDVEIKSWISEVPRSFLERKYQMEFPTKFPARYFTIMQNRFFGTPALLKEADRRFEKFLEETSLNEPPRDYTHSDLYYWEVELGAWGTTVASSQDFHHVVTMPFNNRKLISSLLRLPEGMRRADIPHKMIMAHFVPQIVKATDQVRNLYFHGYRILMEQAYFLYRTTPARLARTIRRDIRGHQDAS